MAEASAIAWTDSTFNAWIGCTKVGPGCDHCYAEALDKRHRWGGAVHWGAGVPRKRTSEAYWRQPLNWNKKAAASGKPWRVFCCSLADVLDNEAPDEWRHDLYQLITITPALTWMLLTKRIGNAKKMLPGQWLASPLPNVWIGATIVNQEEADRDIPKLLDIPAAVHWISYEPALGPVDWTKFRGIDWIITGGESQQGSGLARGFDIEWARDTLHQCRVINAAFFMKQTGSDYTALYERTQKNRAGADPAEWPEDIRVREFPMEER